MLNILVYGKILRFANICEYLRRILSVFMLIVILIIFFYIKNICL